ncbi:MULTISPECIES: hypothetical protein [Paraliobacillus]|uniref:hypothetical protein n=1 Tax=Paraliobacillus TaxID=200903 RepID=UPI000DD3F59E|nr:MULTISPECIES: hypothetical protein [Paraliobacillus]
MKTTFNNKPKGFGEILDLTFRIIKNHFSSLFLIMIIFMGPVFLLQAISQLIGGRNFFRELETGGNVFDQILNSYTQTAQEVPIVESMGTIFIGLLAILFYPVAYAAIIILVKRIKNDEAYTVGSVIRSAFTRFWPLLWSTLLIGLIVFAIVFIPLVIVISILAGVAFFDPTTGIAPFIVALILFIIVLIGMGIGLGLLFTKWSFYLPAVVFDRVAPGLSKSWMLTKNRTWKLFGLYVVLSLIIAGISIAIEIPASFLGMSVLYSIIINLATLITSIIFTVGYAVMYFDAETRNTAGDLKDMIDEYQDDVDQ